MPFDVEMPDGTVIEDVPDGTPKEVIAQKWRSMQQKEQPQQAVSSPKWKGFVPAEVSKNIPNALNQAASGFVEGSVALGNLPMQMVRMGGEALGVPPKYLPLSTAEINQRNRETGFTASSPQGIGGKIARFAGEVAPSLIAFKAPTSAVEAASMGAILGGSQPAKTPEEFSTNVGVGGAAGGVMGAIFSPANRPEVRKLVKEGVNPTVGQLYGGAAQRAEEGLTSVPLVGDVIRTGQRRAVRELNTATINRALQPIGKSLPKGSAGREAVEAAEDILSKEYGSILPKITGKADDAFIQEIEGAKLIVRNLSDDTANQLEKILKNEITDKFAKGGGEISGETFKGIESELGTIAREYGRSEHYDTRVLGHAVEAVRDSLRSMIARSNPQEQAALSRINKGWANLTRVKLASAADKTGEMFSPAQLQAAVKRSDPSKAKSAFARGEALLQDLSEPAYNVLGSKVPDSGTPFRALTGAAALGGASYVSPYAALGVPLLGLYAPRVQSVVAKGLTSPSALRAVPAVSVGTVKAR